MFNKFNHFFLPLCLLFALTQSLKAQNTQLLERDWRNDREKISVISYNIMDGFKNSSDKDRMERFVTWVKKESPDILALNELCGFTEGKLKTLAATYGHPYSAIVKENGYPVGLTSKFPIKIIDKRIEGYGHGLLHCRVLNMNFLITHLNPSSLEKRKIEAKNIVDYIKENHLKKCLLMGDMNAQSPFDFLWPNIKKQDCSVISKFMGASLNDICYMFVPKKERYTFPTRILVNSPKGETLRLRQERIDFIFTTDDLLSSCVDATIYNTPENDYLSDHYPVGIRLLIPKQIEKTK